jgi:hypothetical protein
MELIINNQGIFQTNSSVHNINTKDEQHLHRPNAKLSSFQKSKFYAGIKLSNNLPTSVTILKNGKAIFIPAFRKYLTTQSFYCVFGFCI